eukprot:CAMPEP_0115010360 /NCGR_PEP_ID=MMETSP0216-20121206/23271_1 /TAXON_ID=223996 /ORGANISM="Protocruzia adherens, Strain Boccale" /LENGTH=150 /DNA_ID=CAMNT_0002378563 /DNA_START=43 /DNA_END=495 /DNA_ORIENTATION=-
MADKKGDDEGDYNKEQDRYLPIANISRIMKRALPSNAKIAKDAKETVQECVSEFISFITSEACDKCSNEKRKTINGDDLLYAMKTLGFEHYLDTLRRYLQKYRELTKTEKQGEEGMGEMGNLGGEEDIGEGFNNGMPYIQKEGEESKNPN